MKRTEMILAALLVLSALSDVRPQSGERGDGSVIGTGYIVIWKSRYNDKTYRTEWWYGDSKTAEAVAEEMRQFHAFTDVRVIVVPIISSPDGVTGRIDTDAFAGSFATRGTGAFTVTDLRSTVVPGGGVAGNAGSQVISLRRAEVNTKGPEGTGRPTANTSARSGGDGGDRLVFKENAPKGQESAKGSQLGKNEEKIREEMLRAKSEVLQDGKKRLDMERERINDSAAKGTTDEARRDKYQEDLDFYKQLVERLQRDLKLHGAKYDVGAGPLEGTTWDDDNQMKKCVVTFQKEGTCRVVGLAFDDICQWEQKGNKFYMAYIDENGKKWWEVNAIIAGDRIEGTFTNNTRQTKYVATKR
jgi:hypothetical protein